MVTLEVHEKDVPVTLWSAELEALSLVPKAWVDHSRAEALKNRLVEQALPYLRESLAVAAKVRRLREVFKLVQCADWHGGRCVFALEPEGLFLKPKKRGAEEIVYHLLADVARERLGKQVSVQFQRVDGFLVQEAINGQIGLFDERASGLILGVIFLMGLTDLNAENLRPLNGVPVPIDVECAFDLSFYTHDSQAVVIRRLREQAQALEMSSTGNTVPSLRPWLTPRFVDAFAEGAIYARERLKLVLNCPSELDKLFLRRVFLPTRVYLNFIRRRALFQWGEEQAHSRWLHLRGRAVSAALVNNELQSLLTGNVPFFHRRGTDLLEGTGGEILSVFPESLSREVEQWAHRWSDEAIFELSRALARPDS